MQQNRRRLRQPRPRLREDPERERAGPGRKQAGAERRRGSVTPGRPPGDAKRRRRRERQAGDQVGRRAPEIRIGADPLAAAIGSAQSFRELEMPFRLRRAAAVRVFRSRLAMPQPSPPTYRRNVRSGGRTAATLKSLRTASQASIARLWRKPQR